VIGRSPGDRRIVYAFGHQHVGMCSGAPTGRIVGDLVAGRDDRIDLMPFRVDRFRRASASS
jgi:D-amino-acid dehydrogenase